MTGYISKKDLMEYCSNSIDRTIDLNDIPRCTACKNSEVYKTNFCPNCGAYMMEEKDDAKVRG